MSSKTKTTATKEEVRPALVPKLRFPEFRDVDDWKLVTLQEASLPVAERVGQRKLTPVSISAGIGFVPQSEKFGRDISGNQYQIYTLVSDGDFVFNKGNSLKFPQGCIYLLQGWGQVAAPNVFICFRLKDGYSNGFFQNCFEQNQHGRQLKKHITSGARSNGLLNISKETFFGVEIPTPSPAEQQKIAECLSSVDELIAAQARKVDALKTHKKGLMQQLFHRELETQPRLRFPEFQNAGEWKPKSIGQLGEVVTGSTPSTARREYYGGDRLFVSPADISDGRFIEKTKTTLTELGFQETRPIKANSILFVCIGSTIGKVAQNRHECATNQQINSVVPNSNYSDGFVYYALSGMADKIANLAGIQAVPIVNKSLFSSVELTVPELPEQNRIADCLSSLDETIFGQTQKLESLKTHKQGLMQQLFHIMKQDGKQGLKPKLRFPAFRDAEGWKPSVLADACDMQAGKFVSASNISERNQDGFFPCFGGNGFRGYTATHTHNGTYPLIGRQGALCGNVRLASGQFHATEHAVVATPKEAIDVGWLFYSLDLLNLNRFATGQAQPGLSVDVLENVSLAIPLLESEQQKIAECLSSVDELIAAQARKVDALKTHKKGLMKQLFHRELETQPHLRFPEFQNAPEWNMKPLGKVAENLDNKRRPITSSDREAGDVPYYGASGIVDYVEGYIFDEDLLCVSEDGANLVARTYPIAFPISGNTWVNNHAHVLRFENACTQKFVEVYLNSIKLDDFITGMAQPKLNKAMLDCIPIPHTSVPEQQRIADCLASLDAMITAETQKHEALKTHKQGLMQQLFHIMKQDGKQGLKPKLRFPEFRDADGWAETQLQKIARPVSDRAVTGDGDNVLSLSGEHGLVLQSDYFGKKVAGDSAERYLKLLRNDFVYNDRTTKASTFGTIKRLSKYSGGIVSPIYKCFRFHADENPVFWEWYFESGSHEKQLGSLVNEGARAGRFNISISQFLSTSVWRPTEPEQQKIDECLSSLDELIVAHGQKLDALKFHKKGLMYQLFPREGETLHRLRFPEFQNAGEWDAKQISDVVRSVKTGKLDANAMVENGKYRFYTCAENYYQIDNYAFEGEALLIAGNGANLGYIHHYIGKFNAYQRTYVLQEFAINVLFLKYYLDCNLPARISLEKKAGNTPYIVLGTITEMPLMLPKDEEEQREIADCLASLDELIVGQTQKHEALKTHKKGLMQQLFPIPEEVEA